MSHQFFEVPHSRGRRIQTCIRFFQRTLRGYYNNMSLAESVRKSKPTTNPNRPRKLWLRLAKVTWDSNQQRIFVALAFHRRDEFASGTQSLPDYYLSVGLSDEQIVDPNTGDETDQYDTVEVFDTILDACTQFNNALPADHKNRLYIARHDELDLDQTRLKQVFDYAIDPAQGNLDTVQQTVAATYRTTTTGIRRIWPELWVRKIIL